MVGESAVLVGEANERGGAEKGRAAESLMDEGGEKSGLLEGKKEAFPEEGGPGGCDFRGKVVLKNGAKAVTPGDG